ncbi:MAG: hypothetical protein H6922_05175 [Pseudomonadaceae bacterium]|nr:hypothetical protein [Pseudomonadaceae bacterium]
MSRHIALVILLLLTATPAMASGYLSDYNGNGGSYYSRYGGGNGPLSEYSGGGYAPPTATSTDLGYSGPNTPISRPHRSSWENYVDARRTTLTRATRITPCGNYQRAPRRCWMTTTKFDPLVHTSY